MHVANDVSIRVMVKGDNDTIPQCEVLIAGAPTGAVLAGEVFEAAVQIEDCLMVFVSDGVPFEDGLTVALLEEGGRVLDTARIGEMYATGVFGALTLEPPDTVRFCFMGDGSWTASLSHRPRRLRRWLSPAMWRPGSDRRSLHLSRHNDETCAHQP